MSTDEIDLTISDSTTPPVPGRRLNKYDATTAPTVNDDSGDGYELRSIWIDVTNDKAYICLDSTLTAAVWKQFAGTGVGVTDHGLLTGLDDGDHDTLHVDLTVSGSHTADRDDGVVHDLTLVGNTTITPSAGTLFVAGHAVHLLLLIQQDGTGGWTLAWGGTIVWDTHDGNPPDMPTAPGDVILVALLSRDDGATWFGSAGGSSALATTVESETTFGLSPAVGTGTKSARDDHTHGTPANPVTNDAVGAAGAVGPILVISEPSASPLVFADLVQNSEGTDLLYAAP